MNNTKHTPDQRTVTRVVCCQGTIQLAVAINALLYHERKQYQNNNHIVFKNFLVVHDLFSPANQEAGFFQSIKTIAESILTWSGITYIDAARMQALEDHFHTKGYNAFSMEMAQTCGVAHADEVYLARNWQSGSKLLLSYFETAFKICYGDSIGMYFSEAYFSDKDLRTRLRLSATGKVLSHVKRSALNIVRHPGRRPILKSLQTTSFDFGYLCFPNISREMPRFEYEVIPVSDLRKMFDEFVNHLTIAIPDSILTTDPCAVLLTTNFSEARRMTITQEQRAYAEFVEAGTPVKGALLIKPHPRDAREKIAALQDTFKGEGYSVTVMDDPQLFFIPFEFFLIALDRRAPGRAKQLNYFAVSSACLSIWFLFGVKPHVGLGEQAVKKYFNTFQIKGRLEHETDLRSLMQMTHGL